MPTFLSYLGTLKDPWHPEVKLTLATLQLIWNAVYPDKPYTIEGAGDAVYTQVSLYSSLVSSCAGSTSCTMAAHPCSMVLIIHLTDKAKILRVEEQIPCKRARVSSRLHQENELDI